MPGPTKLLEEVEIYKTYGRTDQAIEVLIEAVNDGFMPPELVLCLLECYIESDRVPEAKILISNLELSKEDDLVDRANQMMLDMGSTRLPRSYKWRIKTFREEAG